ncbi:VCBS domain-containing protein [Xanthobacter autotrophicus]|uniref:VCBS domain-containing protein n=1 Tax=Xanthobacter autotrophicus TaxID=280 RepID=UPI00372BECE6
MANNVPVFTNSGAVTRVSTTAAGAQGNGYSYSPVFSPDGTKVAFYSSASNLVAGGTNGAYDIFVKDLATGAVTRVSADAAGAQGNSSSYSPVFSPDGTKVAFYSYASNLVAGDTNGTYDIFVKDLTTGAVTRVSTDTAGTQGNYDSVIPVFSPDGTKVAFVSVASNLVAGDTNDTPDIFVKDLTTGAVTRVSTDAAGAQGNGGTNDLVFSPDGTKVAFYSYADNLVAGDTNNSADTFVKDLTTGAVTRVSTDAAGAQGNSYSSSPVFSPDGTKVAFYSNASNLVAGDTNGATDIFVKDLTTGAITRVSTDAAGAQGNYYSYSPVFSPDGTKVAFYSYASNLVAGDTNGSADIFVKDLTTGAVTRVSTDAAGAQGNYESYDPVFSPDGTKVAFYSLASNLVAGDTNGTTDIFVKDITAPSVTSATLTDDAAQASLAASGKIYFTDADAGDTHTVAVAPAAGAVGTLSANVVAVAGAADEISWSYAVNTDAIAALDSGESRTDTFTLTLDDGQGGTIAKDVTVTLNGINDAPLITAPAAVSFAENGTGVVLAAAATDPDVEAITWSLSGADAGLFNLAADGTLTFKAAPNFEAPTDAGGNNVYDVVLNASDGQISTTKAVAITVTDVAENHAPEWASGGGDIISNGVITRVSTDAAGVQGNSESSDPVFSPDGTKVAFSSDASNLVAGDNNNSTDIFVKDLTTGAVTRVSTDAAGAQGNGGDSYDPVLSPGGTYDPVFSPDGTKVAFWSFASNLVPGDTNGALDIFVKDLATGAVTRVSTDAAGAQGNSDSVIPVFSPDGTKVAFVSYASNLVAGDTNGTSDIFVKDLTTGAVTRVSTDAAGTQGNYDSYSPVFSPDGTKVAFWSFASNLVAGDTNNTEDIFVKDLTTGAITRVSTDAAGVQGNSESSGPVFSPDGTKVAFFSGASNLVAGDTNGTYDIFVKDLTTGAVTRVSTDAAGAQGNNYSSSPVFSPDGTKVAFLSAASNLVAGDTNGAYDTFVKDLTTGAVTRVSTDAAGAQGNNYSYGSPVFSPDGTKVAFRSYASNLVAGDTNGTYDIFVKDITAPSVTSATLTDDAAQASLAASGKIYFTDADAADTHTVSVAPAAGAVGTLSANVVAVAGAADEIRWSYAVNTDAIAALDSGESRTDTFTLTLDDGQGGTIAKDVTVTLNGINDAPLITAPAAVSFAENGTGVVLAAAATDPDVEAITWSLSGADAGLFNLAADGTLTFKAAPNFEAPTDAGGNNVYDVVLNASDGQISTTKAVAITVTDVAENHAPEWASGGGGGITRVSTDSNGVQGNGYSGNPVFSPDGTKVAFVSLATNLIAGDDNSYSYDIFVKDLTTGTTTIISTDSTGLQGYVANQDFVFSPDGTKVAFVSSAKILVAGDTNNTADIFVQDLTTGVITRVSTDATGVQGDSASLRPVFSPDGTKVAFVSSASNLIPGEFNNSANIYVKDLSTGTVTRVSADAAGTRAYGSSWDPVFSPDGSKVAFLSSDSNLVPGDTNGADDIFVKDLTSGSITRVSTDAAGVEGNNSSSGRIVFSPDGTKVAFVSYASNLVQGDTNITADVFVKDLTTGSIIRVSTDASGAQANNDSSEPVFSPDGTKVAFRSSASNLVPGDTNARADIFVKDLTTGSITRVSTDAAGVQENAGGIGRLDFSPDGTKVVFQSYASNLVPGDTNGDGDVFVKDISPPSATSAVLVDNASKATLSATGKLYFTDTDAADTHTVTVAPQAGTLGTLSATVVPVANGPDRIDWSYAVNTDAIAYLDAGQSRTETFTLTLDDGHGGIITKDVTVTLNGIDDAPVLIYGSSSHQIAENSKAAIAIPASGFDPEGKALTYSLSGADAAFFTVDAKGIVIAKSGLDYEAKADANHDNIYDVTVLASDGVNTTPTTLAITVTNVNEVPLIRDAGIHPYAENGTGPILKIEAVDPDGDALTYALGGTDAGLFKVAADGTVSFKAAPDYEKPLDANHDNIYDLTLISSDGGLSTQSAYSVKVTDVAESTAPVPIVASDAGGTLSGTAGDDVIVGGKGNDVLLAGNGNDTVSGGDGFNMLYGENGNDTLNGGSGFDQLFGGTDDDTLHGGAGNDMLWGEGGHNKVYGDAGNDQLFAGIDGDWLEGGAGRDMLFGSIGADMFVIAGPSAADADQFFGFASGKDKVAIHGADYGLAAGALDAGHFQVGSQATGSTGTFVYNPTVGTLSWDADGAGSGASVTVATFIGGSLALGDLLVV